MIYLYHKNINNKNMENQERLIITFSGNKKSLKKQLKIWCAEADKTMNGTIMELIKKHLNKKQNDKNKNNPKIK